MRNARMKTSCLLVALLPLGGCTALAVGVIAAGAAYGAVKYTSNEALRDYAEDLEDTWEATRAELRSMGYAVAEEITVSSAGGSIEVGDADVEVRTVSGEYTRVTARFGTFETDEHKAKARRLLDGIAERLGE